MHSGNASSSTPRWKTYIAITILFASSFLVFYAHLDPADSGEPELPKSESPAPSIWGRKGVYLTSFFLTKEGNLDEIIDHLNKTQLDSVVINAKNMRGEVTYNTEVELAEKIGARLKRIDFGEIVKRLKEEGIYVIARLVVFYDPMLARYLKTGDPHWVSPSSETAVNYNLAIAKELIKKGIDEIQFDYIRYPDEGLGSNQDFEYRYRAINNFLQRAHEELSSQVNLSADVFGRTLWEWNRKKIDPIGQHLEAVSNYVDILSPMLYPSHFNQKFWNTPYQVVKKTLNIGKERKLKLRPFIQAFERSIPPQISLPEYINKQIDAVIDAGIKGFLVWNPRSDYSPLWQALRLRD